MGERLVHEVLDFAPDALTTPERLALVALAALADDETRRCPKAVTGTDRFLTPPLPKGRGFLAHVGWGPAVRQLLHDQHQPG